MRFPIYAGILLTCLWPVSACDAREWADQSGGFRAEAELVTLREGNAYLEKPDGAVVKIEIIRLSSMDQEYLLSLPKYREYFQKYPIPGKRMAVISVPDENKVGEIRRFDDLRWGVASLAFSPDGALLAVGKPDRALILFDVDKSTRTAFLEKLVNLGEVVCLAFTADGKKLLSAGAEGRIQVWNVGPSGELTEANRFVGHSTGVGTIAISSDGKTVISGGGEKKLRCWDLESAREQFAIDGFNDSVRATLFSHDGKQALACDGSVLVLIDLAKGKVIQGMRLATHAARAVAISPTGMHVVVCDLYALRIWETRTGRELPRLQDRETQWTIRFTPNGKYILSGGSNKVSLWEVATQRRIYEFDTTGGGSVQNLACSPDRRHFAAAAGSAGGIVHVFRLPDDVAKE